jgi:O-antigen ligase
VLNDRGLWSLWTVVPAFCLAVALPKLRWQWRALLLALVVANLYQTMMLNQFWKSGWVPTLAALYVAVLMRSRPWFVVMVLISLAVGYREREFLAQMTQAEMLEGADQRIGMWEINARIVGDHWLLGTGPAGYAVYYMNYYPNDARSTHNNYLDILAQFGVLGMGAWIWLSVAAVVEGARLYRSLAPGFLKTLTMTVISGWLGALGSMMLGDWLLPFAYNQTITGYKYTVYTWLFLGMLISIRAIRGRTVDAVPVEEPNP